MFYFRESKLARLLKRVKVVIFDMDGLIVDNENLQLASTNKALSPYKIKITEKEWMKKCIGKRSREFFQEIIKENSILLRENLEELVERKNFYYQKLIGKEVERIVRPGVREFIDFLWRSSYKLALATSAGRGETEAVIGSQGLKIKDKFQVIVVGDEVKNPKPHPEIYRIISRKMKISPALCLVLEDTAIGVRAAKAAGMRVIAVPHRYTINQNFSEADYVITDLSREAKIIN